MIDENADTADLTDEADNKAGKPDKKPKPRMVGGERGAKKGAAQ